MSDPPRLPPRHEPHSFPPVYRSKKPSGPELLDALTGSHSIDSEPPAARWLDRRIGRAVRIGFRWVIRTKAGTALVAALSAFLTWLSHHIFHWMGP